MMKLRALRVSTRCTEQRLERRSLVLELTAVDKRDATGCHALAAHSLDNPNLGVRQLPNYSGRNDTGRQAAR